MDARPGEEHIASDGVPTRAGPAVSSRMRFPRSTRSRCYGHWGPASGTLGSGTMGFGGLWSAPWALRSGIARFGVRPWGPAPLTLGSGTAHFGVRHRSLWGAAPLTLGSDAGLWGSAPWALGFDGMGFGVRRHGLWGSTHGLWGSTHGLWGSTHGLWGPIFVLEFLPSP